MEEFSTSSIVDSYAKILVMFIMFSLVFIGSFCFVLIFFKLDKYLFLVFLVSYLVVKSLTFIFIDLTEHIFLMKCILLFLFLIFLNLIEFLLLTSLHFLLIPYNLNDFSCNLMSLVSFDKSSFSNNLLKILPLSSFLFLFLFF